MKCGECCGKGAGKWKPGLFTPGGGFLDGRERNFRVVSWLPESAIDENADYIDALFSFAFSLCNMPCAFLGGGAKDIWTGGGSTFG